jgi:hypothetical protein
MLAHDMFSLSLCLSTILCFVVAQILLWQCCLWPLFICGIKTFLWSCLRSMLAHHMFSLSLCLSTILCFVVAPNTFVTKTSCLSLTLCLRRMLALVIVCHRSCVALSLVVSNRLLILPSILYPRQVLFYSWSCFVTLTTTSRFPLFKQVYCAYCTNTISVVSFSKHNYCVVSLSIIVAVSHLRSTQNVECPSR